MTGEGGVAAVERALAILDVITEERVSLAEITKRTGIVKSTVLRILKSLEKFGYVLRLEDGSYRVGARAYQVGCLYQRHFRSVDVIPPLLRRLADELQEGASFYVREADKRICLHRVDPPRAVRELVREGVALPLSVGATGHVLRAFSGARGEKFDDIRRAMFATSFGERDRETAAVAAPVFGVDNKLVGALSVSGPRYRLESLGTEQVVPVLFKYAKELTRDLGGNINEPAFAGWRTFGRKQVSIRD